MQKEKITKKIKVLTWPIILILSQVFIGFTAYSLLSIFFTSDSKIFNNIYILITIIFNIIFILLIIKKKRLNKEIKNIKPKQIFFIIFITLIYSILWNLIFIVKEKSSFSLLIFISTCIIGPILEEIIYRKLVVDMLNKKNKYFISTLLFAISHINLYKMISSFCAGSVFYYFLNKYKSIYASIISHITYNIVCYLFMINII